MDLCTLYSLYVVVLPLSHIFLDFFGDDDDDADDDDLLYKKK